MLISGGCKDDSDNGGEDCYFWVTEVSKRACLFAEDVV